MKKGFTLIELLAVIVILSVISLIATPITNDMQRAWLIFENGTLQYGKLVYNADYKYGIRPVITISKIIIG